MLFKPYLAEAITRGEKTQARRLIISATAPTGTTATAIHNGTVLYDSHIIAVYHNHRLRWRVDKTYAIQPGRGKKAIGRLRLLSIRHEPLQAITSADAIAEGLAAYPDPTRGFSGQWNDINTIPGTRWQDNPEVFVLTFELVPQIRRIQ